MGHVTEAIQFGLRNPQNLGICGTKTLCEVHQTLFPHPNEKGKK